MQSNYLSALTSTSPMYTPTDSDCNLLDYYEAVQISVVKNGCYIFERKSSISVYSTIYKESFDPFSSSGYKIHMNGRTYNSYQPNFGIYLQTNTIYILVVGKSYSNVSESFSIIISGPNQVTFHLLSKY